MRLWCDVEAVYAAGGYTATGQPGALRYTPGLPNVVITAANGVNYYRGTAQRKASRWTGSAAEALAAATGFSALCAAGPPLQVPYRDNPEYALSDRLRQLAGPGVFVLDIGGMRDRSVDLCLGMGPTPDPLSQRVAGHITRALTARGVRVAINDPFAALPPVTVTAFTQSLGASALQMQLAAWLRDPSGAPTVAKLVLDVLRDALAGTA